MKRILIAAALPAALLASPVLAQDNTGDMGGLYAGALVGIDSVRISDGIDSGSESDIGYGINAGYDFDMGQAVFGIEAELMDSGVSSTATDIFAAGDAATLSAGRDLYIGARAGFKAGASTLVYVKGGYTDARVKLTYDDGVTVESGSDSLGGFRVGAGVERRLVANLAVRAEYRYSDYGEYSYEGVATGLSAKRHQGMVALVGKF